MSNRRPCFMRYDHESEGISGIPGLTTTILKGHRHEQDILSRILKPLGGKVNSSIERGIREQAALLPADRWFVPWRLEKVF